MNSFKNLKDFFSETGYKMIIVADAEPRVTTLVDGKLKTENPAGGVAIALDSMAQATEALYIGRAKNKVELELLDKNGEMKVRGTRGDFTLKRLLFDDRDVSGYYTGFSTQTLWSLCHVAFEEPKWKDDWYQKYKKVNQVFANAILKNLDKKQKTFIWINDYQLSLVPLFLGRPKNTIVSMFWHIPWPTWELFRILPYKTEILQSLLACDYLAFHRGYQARNFRQTVERELQVRIDDETQKVFYHKNKTLVKNLPMGIDVDIIKGLVREKKADNGLVTAVKRSIDVGDKSDDVNKYLEKYKLILGVDRLDYTKGLKHRLVALDKFFEKYPSFLKKVVYMGIIAPSRETIPSYQKIKVEVEELAQEINLKYGREDWKPIHIIYGLFRRDEIVNFYSRAAVCIVTPLDDGMNLVSKEFVVASAVSQNPGMLVLSQFTGSAIDLTSALIVNPYDIVGIARAVKQGLEMPTEDKVERIRQMAAQLEENNVYEWGLRFIREALSTKR